MEEMYTYRLPRVHLQFICHQDIRSEFSVVNMFDSYYRQLLPHLTNTTLRNELMSNSMKDIPHSKWYFSNCNISSPQVLLTMETEGWAQYSMDWNGTASPEPYGDDQFKQMIMQQVTSDSLQNYIQLNVCNSMEIYRAYIEDWSNSTPESFENDQYIDHSLILLCGGEDYIYYDEADPDGGFIVFGLLVGFLMVGMIVGELQKFQDRPNQNGSTSRRSSRRRERYQVDYAITPTELEMV